MSRAVTDVAGGPFHVALGKRLEFLRERLEFTQQEMADRVGKSQQTLYAYEAGIYRVPVALLPEFARVFGVSCDALLGLSAAPRLPKWRASPAQLRHVEQLRQLATPDRLAVMRITQALGRLET